MQQAQFFTAYSATPILPEQFVLLSILPLRCEVFRAMFVTSNKPDFEETQPTSLVLSDIQPNVFLAMLEFIYTNCCSLSTDMVSMYSHVHSLQCQRIDIQVIDVLAASIEYGLDGLTKVIENVFHCMVDPAP